MTAFEKKETAAAITAVTAAAPEQNRTGIDPSETETAEEVPGTDQEPTDDGEKTHRLTPKQKK